MNAMTPDSTVRLNRFLAETGASSRRDADQIIFSGQVTVNGSVVKIPAFRIDPRRDAVKVAGRRVQPQPLVYVLLNKPEGIVSTAEDPEGRPAVVEMLKGVRARVYPVGRLDINTSGVMLLTNDGELTLRLTHPRYGFPKTYQAKVEGVPTPSAVQKLRMGVHIPTWSGRYEKTLPARVQILKTFGKHALLELTLCEGKQNQIRKMCRAVGLTVVKLARIKFGFLTAHGLRLGEWRYLTVEEIHRLQAFRSAVAKPWHRP